MQKRPDTSLKSAVERRNDPKCCHASHPSHPSHNDFPLLMDSGVPLPRRASMLSTQTLSQLPLIISTTSSLILHRMDEE